MRIITTEGLLFCIGFLCFCITTLWGVLAVILLNKRQQTERQKTLEKNIVRALAKTFDQPKNESAANFVWVKPYLTNNAKLWLLGKVLIKVNNLLHGTKPEAVSSFSDAIGLTAIIKTKLGSTDWFEKVMAIRLSHELGLKQHLPEIALLCAHENTFIRRESQIALVVFLGWQSLVLLSEYNFPISQWQQICIIKKLRKYYPTVDRASIGTAIEANNHNITRLLILIIGHFSMHQYNTYLRKHTNSEEEGISDNAYQSLHKVGYNSFDTWVELCKRNKSTLSKPLPIS